MDYIQAYVVMGLLMSAYAAWVDPFPRMHGLVYDIVLYTLFGVFWPIVWVAAMILYIQPRR